MLHTRKGLFALLVLVFVLNWVETTAEGALNAHFEDLSEWRQRVALAINQVERGFRFTDHDVADPVAVYGYSISYFFVLPILFLYVGSAVYRRRDLSPFRVFALSIAFDYWMSLPFFLLFPVPERWSCPESGAILLSDLWSSSLIELIRPISGLDNSFPSFHVSMSVVIAMVCLVLRIRLRYTVAALAATIVLSTFVLGIHWMPDMVAGVALGVLSVLLAVRLDRQLRERAEPDGGVVEVAPMDGYQQAMAG